MSLTDDWKARKLDDGFYFIKLKNGKTPVAELETWYKPNKETGEVETIETAFSGYPDDIIAEVLALCDYDHISELEEKAKKYDRIKVNGNYPDKISRLKSRIKHLLDMQANQDEEVEKLRELLEKCDNELKILRIVSLSIASVEAIEECDELLIKINEVLK